MSRDLVPYDDTDDDFEVAVESSRLPITYTPEGVAAMHDFAPPPGSPPISNEDRPLVASFLSALRGAPPNFVIKALRWYSTLDEDIRAVQAERDRADRDEGLYQLRKDLGAGTDAAIADAVRYHRSLPLPLASALETARLPDGRLITNSPMGVRWLADLGRTMRTGTTPRQRSDSAEEIREIENVMRTDRRRYNADTQMQERYRQLISQRDA